MRCAPFGPTPGSWPSSSIRSWTTPSYTAGPPQFSLGPGRSSSGSPAAARLTGLARRAPAGWPGDAEQAAEIRHTGHAAAAAEARPRTAPSSPAAARRPRGRHRGRRPAQGRRSSARSPRGSPASMAAASIDRSTSSPWPLTVAVTRPPPAVPSTSASASSCCAFISWLCIAAAAARSCCISSWPPGSTRPPDGSGCARHPEPTACRADAAARRGRRAGASRRGALGPVELLDDPAAELALDQVSPGQHVGRRPVPGLWLARRRLRGTPASRAAAAGPLRAGRGRPRRTGRRAARARLAVARQAGRLCVPRLRSGELAAAP